MVKRTLRWLLNKLIDNDITMHKEILKDSLYGSLAEITKNPRLYRFTPVGKQYCFFTEEGKQAIIEWVENHAAEIASAEDIMIRERAKKLVVEELKK